MAKRRRQLKFLFTGAILVLLMMSIFYFYDKPLVSLQHLSATKHDDGLQTVDRLVNRSCDFHFSEHYNVRCYYYRTHENLGFYLPVAVLKRKAGFSAKKASQNVLIQIPGGPGQGFMTNAEEIQYWGDLMHAHKWDFDVLLYDPRGTGEGKYAWFCQSILTATQDIFAANLSLQEEYSVSQKVLSECHKQFMSQLRTRLPHVDAEEALIDSFSAAEQAKDIDAIVTALGYEKAHLFASSYGTRVALMAASYPSITSLILDAVYPFEYGLMSQEPELMRKAFDAHERLYSQFYGEPKSKNGSFQTLYSRARSKLKQAPLPIVAEHFRSETTVSYLLTHERLLDVVFNSLYRKDVYGALYRGLRHYVDSGNSSPDLVDVLSSYVSNAYDKDFNSMVFFAAECADNKKETRAEIESQFETFVELESHLRIGLDYDACDIFRSTGSFAVQGRNYSNKPTLIFSGEFDPITPADWGDALASALPLARHVRIAGAGHGVLFSGVCDLSFIDSFIRSGDVNIPLHCEDVTQWP